MKYIQPIILIPNGYATDEHVVSCVAAKSVIEEWFESQYRADLMIYWLRPLTPICKQDMEYFGLGKDLRSDSTVWSQTRKWLVDEGYTVQVPQAYAVPLKDVFFVVFMQDYNYQLVDADEEQASWWGHASIGQSNVNLRVAVLDLDMLDDLAGLNNLADGFTAGVNAGDAAGVLCHEIGHMFGFHHTDIPFPNVMSSWWYWPYANVPSQKAT